MQQEVVSNFRVLKNTEKTISYLKKTRKDIFSIDNIHFGWKQCYSIKEIRKFPELKKQIDLDESDLNMIVDNFKKWNKIPTYLMFQDEEGNLSCALASKRGNKIYEHFLQNSLRKRLSFMENPKFEEKILRGKEGFRTQISNCLFITLTCDPKKYNNSRIVAWLNFEHDYNIFTTRFRKEFGKTTFIKVVESTKKGFPHIHLIAITETDFNVFKPKRRKCSNKKCEKYFTTLSYNFIIICPYCNSKINHPLRIKERNQIRKLWGSSVDIEIPDISQKEQESTTLEFMIDYIFKDMVKQYKTKNYKVENRSHQDNLSLALGWLFGKRCYSISKMDLSLDLITDASVTQTQIKDFIKKNSERNFIFMGLIDFKFVSNKPPPIFFEIPKSDPNYENYLNGIYGKREKPTFYIEEKKPRKIIFDYEKQKINLKEIKTKKTINKIFFTKGSDEPLIISYHNPQTAERFSGSMQKIRRDLFIKYLEKQRSIISKQFFNSGVRGILERAKMNNDLNYDREFIKNEI